LLIIKKVCLKSLGQDAKDPFEKHKLTTFKNAANLGFIESG